MCPKMCRHICPSANVTKNELDNPNARCLQAYMVDSEKAEHTPASIMHIYKCMTCKHCCTDQWCPVEDIDVPKIMRHARADIVEMGLQPPGVDTLLRNVLEKKNPFGKDRSERFSDLVLNDGEKEGSKVLYFAGCMSSYNRQEVVKAMQNIFEKADVDHTFLKEGACCGYPLISAGYMQEAKEEAGKLVDKINKLSCDTVVAECPTCYYMFTRYYPEEFDLHIEAEVVHSSQYINNLLEKKDIKLVNPFDKKILYHDPCSLSRQTGVLDVPRDILKKVPESDMIEDYFWSRENSQCCGGGAVQISGVEEHSYEVGKVSLLNMLKKNPDVIVTGCPTCKDRFTKIRDNMLEGNGKVEILTLTEVVSKSI